MKKIFSVGLLLTVFAFKGATALPNKTIGLEVNRCNIYSSNDITRQH